MKWASEQTSERSGVREQNKQGGASKQVSGASEWANEQTDERVAQYFSLYSWLFWPTVNWDKALQGKSSWREENENNRKSLAKQARGLAVGVRDPLQVKWGKKDEVKHSDGENENNKRVWLSRLEVWQ